MYRRKLNRAWETLRSMPMPAIASDRLVDLHNDLTDYDTTVARLMREFLRGNRINRSEIRIDVELEEALRLFKAESAAFGSTAPAIEAQLNAAILFSKASLGLAMKTATSPSRSST